MGKNELLKQPKQYINPKTFVIGCIDSFSNYMIELPDHHVYLDDRSFFSKIMQGDKIKFERSKDRSF